MKKHLLIHLLACLFFFPIPSLMMGQFVFQYDYQFGLNQSVGIERNDDYYYLGGGVNPTGTNIDVGLHVTRYDGSQRWSYRYGGSEADEFSSISRTSNSDFVLLASTQSYVSGAGDSSNLLVIRINSTGAVELSTSIGTMNTEKAISMYQSGSGFIIVGTSDSAGVKRPYLVRMDAQLQPLWARVYTSANSGDKVPTAVTSTFDGGYVMTGYVTPLSAPNERHLFVTKVDNSGAVVFANEYHHLDSGFTDRVTLGHDVIIGSASRFAIAGAVGGFSNAAGSTIYNPFLLILDANGGFVDAKSYAINHGDSRAVKVWETLPGGGYVLGGTMGNDYFMMMRVYQNLDTWWCYRYDQNLGSMGNVTDLRDGLYGGFVLVGPLKTNGDMRLVNTDDNGQSGCPQGVPPGGGMSSPQTLYANTPTWSSFPSLGATALTLHRQSAVYTSSPVCSFVGVTAPATTSHFSVYPNPGRDDLHVEVKGAKRLAITNLFGQIMLSRDLDPRAPQHLQLDVADWAAGVYLIRAGSETRKFIKE